ncbi:hypothetical protein LEN26_013322 [Aphanomyces euteiches]|nr:hypothetical protein LEN26_013322 [Aphanomyces euteiches]KAH9116484.1 hypothetical protein AeMF1_009575 [Aphanomyces euteiches]KAH9194687.1 hypothetical protein AeNC1_003327 [Aphanomyces euteiches]
MVYKVNTISAVSAKVVGVGDFHKVVLYILRIDHGSRTWYVSRRYSEFRELMLTIQTHAAQHADACDICNDVLSLGLARSNGFPGRKWLHSEAVATSRLDELAVFVKNVMITTQGSLDDNDNHHARRCDIPKALARFFLLTPQPPRSQQSNNNDDNDDAMRSLPFGQLRMIRQTDDALQAETMINSPPTNALHRQHSLVIYP